MENFTSQIEKTHFVPQCFWVENWKMKTKIIHIYIYVHILCIYIYVYIWMKPTSSLSRLSRAQLYSPTILPILNEMNNLHVQRLNKHRLKATGKNSHQTGHLFISSADAWAWHQKWQHPQPWHLKHEMGKVLISPTKTRHYYKGNLWKLPYVCIVWSPRNG